MYSFFIKGFSYSSNRKIRIFKDRETAFFCLSETVS